MMKLEVYDLECLSNIFTYTGYNPYEDKYYQYVICGWRNDSKELYNHLMSEDKLTQVGFNNEAYDYPLEHHFLRHYLEYKDLSGQDVAIKLYNKSQSIIEQQFTTIADRHKYIKQIDLYKIWHYNNKARMTSLKDLEICMKMPNVEEMPIHHTTWCKPGDEKCILDYNKNDVYATFLFLKTTLGKTDYSIYKGKNKIELRRNLTKKFNIDCTNLADVPMGEQLMLSLYSKAIGVSPFDVKRLSTPRNYISLKDCIPFWANIKTPEFNNFLNMIKQTTIRGEKGEFSYSVIFHNYKFDFGLGGSHGCCEPKIWESNKDWMILDLDVSSLYPSIAKSLQLYPEHLGPEFMELYSQFIDKRIAEKHKPKEERDNVLIEGYKLILNGTYGKSNESKSFLYDPLYTFKTTIAGQLFICMWAERMVEAVPELKFIQTNTDGQTIYIPRNKLDKIREVNEQLTKETTLVIEEAFYSKMIVRDVNNYISVYEDSTPDHEHLKLKGDFEIDKEYHKDPSMRIVPMAVKEFFVNNIPIEKTICEHKDIFDFCIRLKTRSGAKACLSYIDKDGTLKKKNLDRTTRYYVSTPKAGSAILTKIFDDGRQTGVSVGANITLFNQYVEKPIEDYNIDYNFYIKEANKLRFAVSTGQLTLF